MPKLKKAGSKAKVEQKVLSRDMLYPEVTLDLCAGNNAMSVNDAKELLGWEEETEQVKFGNNYLLKDERGRKIRCRNNVTNRPLYNTVLQTLKQEHLMRRWRMNGEPIIIGRTGLILNGQHTMISLILAAQVWEDAKEKWSEYWPDEPTMEKVVISGIDESDATVNTMDTCKPRSLADVLYRSEYFANLNPNERRQCSRMADYAIRLLWHRTAAGLDAFAPRRTHSESLDFLSRHQKLLEAIKHVNEENGKENRIGRYLSPGYAAGFLYLMGSCKSDSEAYYQAKDPNENLLDWSMWDRACDWFVELASGGDRSKPVRAAIAHLESSSLDAVPHRWAVIVNAWMDHLEDGNASAENLIPEFATTEDGGHKLLEHPTVGGIDIGSPDQADESMIAQADPSPEVIRQQAETVKKSSSKASKGPAKKLGQPKLRCSRRAGKQWAVGDIAWVKDPDGEHYLAEIMEEPYKCDDDNDRVMVHTDEGNDWEVMLMDLSLEKPGAIKDAKSGQWKLDTLYWVYDKTGEHWKGRLVELSGKAAKLRVAQGFRGAGNVRAAWATDLRLEQPTAV